MDSAVADNGFLTAMPRDVWQELFIVRQVTGSIFLLHFFFFFQSFHHKQDYKVTKMQGVTEWQGYFLFQIMHETLAFKYGTNYFSFFNGAPM